MEIAPFEVFRWQLTLAGSHSLNHTIPRALDVIAGLGPQADRVVSHRVSLEEISQMLATSAPKGGLKVQYLRD